MYFFQVLLFVLGRVGLSSLFIIAGVKHVVYWRETEETLATVLCDWHVYADSLPYAEEAIHFALSWTPLFLGAAVGLLLIGGVFVFLGFRARLGAFFLILFLVPTTVIMHPFWTLHGSNKAREETAFIKNAALLGGLLMVVAHGRGFQSGRRKHQELPPEVQR